MSRQFLLEYILEPELIFLASELLIAERPLRRRRMKSGAFSALAKEGNHLKRPTKFTEIAVHPSAIPIRADRTSSKIFTLAKSDCNDCCRKTQANGDKTWPNCIGYYPLPRPFHRKNSPLLFAHNVGAC
jgi:hypothetical protein